jgi:nitrogen fixation/metabolism regulation signal transduction histidine kinase
MADEMTEPALASEATLEIAERPRPPARFYRPRFSLAGRIAAVLLVSLAVTAAVAAAVPLLPLELPAWMSFLAAILVGLPLGSWLLSRVLRPVEVAVQSLTDGIRSFHDRDFGVRIASHRKDELGELARLYNRVGQTLQDERAAVSERELLLQTALNRSPAAILLINQRDRIIYSNREARRLMMGGQPLEGRSFGDLKAGCPDAMREILTSESDGIFTVPAHEDDQPETYHLSQRHFQLNRKRHTLVVVRRMTGQLGRQEAEIWKKVIRVISHELNNSLAPISSLVHSAQMIAADPQHADRSDEVFGIIEERIDHLKTFLGGYARFARLPAPRKESVDWGEFLNALGEYPELEIVGRLPKREGWFDPAQMRHVMTNLLKNAEEASDGPFEAQLRVDVADDGGTYFQVLDRGRGMSDDVIKKALLPFYSTKRTGSGLGLPLCREIVEAHGGKISLEQREGGGTVVTCWLPGAPPGE